MRFDDFTRFVATMLWSAHIKADPSYHASHLTGLTVEQSQDASATLCLISFGGVWS